MSDLCEKCGYDWLEGDAMSRTIDEQKALLARAADALGPYEWGFPDGSAIRQLIAELRKAAE